MNQIIGKDRFFKVYANIPINLRNEIVLVLPDGPITWKVAYLEINQDTPLGEIILNKLVEIAVI